MKNDDWLLQALEENECLLADGFDSALIGITSGINPVAVYDINQMLTILVKREKMNVEDALEHLDFNVIGAYVGEKTPIYMDLDKIRACAYVQDY
jgi:hypothetical protein|tara:strand:- start:80 stop:364 length:285 start_codon:yes stop_codon:yes gene_type:complete